MNKLLKYIPLLLVVLLSIGCGDEYSHLEIVKEVDGSARLKVYHMVPDQTGSIMKIDNKLVSGVLTSTGLPNLVNYGSVFPLAEYTTVEPGNRSLLVSFLNADRTASVDVTSNLNLAANKFYSAFVVGQAGNQSVILADDELPATDTAKTHIRFINTITNTPAEGYEVLVNNVVVDTKTTVTDGKDKFVAYDQLGPTRFTVILRQKGTTTALVTSSNNNLSRGRAYTFIIRGIHGNTSTTLRPAFSLAAQ